MNKTTEIKAKLRKQSFLAVTFDGAQNKLPEKREAFIKLDAALQAIDELEKETKKEKVNG